MTRRLALATLVAPLFGQLAVTRAQAPAPRVINVAAQRFEFWPSEIRVQPGEAIEFRVYSDDTLHGFRIVGTSVNVTIPKRGKGETSVSFVAPAAGRYTIECSRLCGAGHNFMRATLVVREARS